MYLPFICKNPIILSCYIKLHYVYFNDFRILFKNIRYWKIDFFNSDLFESQFQ